MYDLFIIGGGINGAGIARDASGRGLKVFLIDKNKVGEATSSWSTKLIHGGLRYLENYNFRLVRESLKEREIINHIASRIVKPVPFIIPHNPNLRPAWMIKLGLIIYDNLGGKTKIPKSNSFNLQQKYPNILKDNYTKCFQYFDLQVDDKLLTRLNIEDAKERGAIILEDTNIRNVQRRKDYWTIKLNNHQEVKSKILINASGPWINEVNKKILKNNNLKKIRLVKGSHIVVPKIYTPNIAFTLQNKDKRIVFAIPYKEKFTLIGTTEIEVSSPENPKIDNSEIKYLIDCINSYFKIKINEQMITYSYSGVRPLIEDFKNNSSNLSRDYIFDINFSKDQACLINIYGGKLTTYRKMSEKIIENLNIFFPNLKKSWTDKYKL